MGYQPRVYISCPYDPKGSILGAQRQQLREVILRVVQKQGFAPQEFGVSGSPQGCDWDFVKASQVMNQCDGALVIALARSFATRHTPIGDIPYPVPTEYNHLEGGLAIAARLPLLVIAEEDMDPRGILKEGGASVKIEVNIDDAERLEEGALEAEPVFQQWVDNINERRDVFLGYCSKASKPAKRIKDVLREGGITVMDWAEDFRPGRTIMEEVSRAALQCRTGLFLFTADDPTGTSDRPSAVPRDNVLLEAGYFTSVKTLGRVLIVRERGANMPADLGGVIYLSVDTPKQWGAVAKNVVDSIRHMLEGT